MYANKPILGLVGGIGSGKSFVASLFAEQGCMVIDSDAQVRDAYRDAKVIQEIRSWWGDETITESGAMNRAAIAARVFADPEAKKKLESLLHPLVHAARERQMQAGASDPQVVAYVWDTPLLIEAGLAAHCDAIVFIDTPLRERQSRVASRSNLAPADHLLREKSQTPLDTKRRLSDYVITNAVDAKDGTEALADLREQVRRVLSQVLAKETRASARAKLDPPMSEE
jgi:dephospho-CoA kinase